VIKTVVFVCIHNSGRSQMAEAFFNQMAQGKALALSAGTRPGDKVNPTVVEAMREIGIDISGNKPKTMTLDMLSKADKMITMVARLMPLVYVQLALLKLKIGRWKTRKGNRWNRSERFEMR